MVLLNCIWENFCQLLILKKCLFLEHLLAILLIHKSNINRAFNSFNIQLVMTTMLLTNELHIQLWGRMEFKVVKLFDVVVTIVSLVLKQSFMKSYQPCMLQMYNSCCMIAHNFWKLFFECLLCIIHKFVNDCKPKCFGNVHAFYVTCH